MKKTILDKDSLLAGVFIKGKDRRINVALHVDSYGDKVFVIDTKRLIDFKTRNITSTTSLYTFESFMLMKDAIMALLENSTVGNKYILRELKAFQDKIEEEGKPLGTIFIKDEDNV